MRSEKEIRQVIRGLQLCGLIHGPSIECSEGAIEALEWVLEEKSNLPNEVSYYMKIYKELANATPDITKRQLEDVQKVDPKLAKYIQELICG